MIVPHDEVIEHADVDQRERVALWRGIANAKFARICISSAPNWKSPFHLNSPQANLPGTAAELKGSSHAALPKI